MGKCNIVRASTLVVPALLLVGSSQAATQEQKKETTPGPPAEATPAVDPKAKDALTRMTDEFKRLPTFSVHEDITREMVIDEDLKVQKSSVANIVVRRPNGMRFDVVADDDKSHSVFYDGKTLTAFVPGKNYFAQTAAPDTLAATVDMAESQYGIELPTTDLLRMGMGEEDFTKELTAAGVVGASRCGDDECDHYAYRSADVDYQLWVESGDKALLRKIVITSKKQPMQPEYTAVLSWNLSPKIDDGIFTFVAPEGATKIVFGTMVPGGAKGAPPQNQPKK